MKKIFSIMMMAVTLTMLWGCSSSDDDDVKKSNGAEGPTAETGVDTSTWVLDINNIKSAIDGKPDWQVVDFFDYENSMTAIVFIDEEFGTHLTADDRMAAIVDGEVRDVCAPVPFFDDLEDKDASLDCFMLLIPYRIGENEVELQYYNAEMNQTYTLKDEFSVSEETVGDSERFVFTFCPMAFGLFKLPQDLPCKPGKGDKMAAFMGDVCCGYTEYYEGWEDNTWLMTLYNMSESNERVYIRYYNAEQDAVYTTKPFFTIKNGDFLDARTLLFN